MRSSDPAVARTVAEPVLLALGVRAGVDVDRLDELAIALGIAIAAAVPGPVRTHLSRAGTRISVRTTERADAVAITSAFGGGGHARAAGCTIAAPLDAAREQMLAECERELARSDAGGR